MALLLFLAACGGGEPSPVVDTADRHTGAMDTAGDTAADTGSDTGVDTAPDSAEDSADDSATDTAAELPASISLSGSYVGVPFALACNAGDAGLQRSWSNAVGDKVGSFSCTDGSSLSVTFIDPVVGTWTDPTGGMNYTYTDVGGGVLHWYEGPPTEWSLTFTAVEWTAIDQFVLTGSLTGTWSNGNLAGSFSVAVPCTNC